jgi:hypothetical protein
MLRTNSVKMLVIWRRLDVAMAILEDLAAQIDRHHLEEWESPSLVSQVWDALQGCYAVTSPSEGERAAALLKPASTQRE